VNIAKFVKLDPIPLLDVGGTEWRFDKPACALLVSGAPYGNIVLRASQRMRIALLEVAV
jgi:hypothetical protein